MEPNSTEPDDTIPIPTPATGIAYRDLGLIKPLQQAIDHAGYTHCTPVQQAVIPAAMKGADVIGQAQTGTGKTAAFLVPFLVATLVILVVLNMATAIQRFAKVWKLASKPMPMPRPSAARRRSRASSPSPAAERWRARRAEMHERSRARRNP